MNTPVYLVQPCPTYSADEHRPVWSLFRPYETVFYRHKVSEYLVEIPDHYRMLPDNEGIAQLYPDGHFDDNALLHYEPDGSLSLVTRTFGIERLVPQPV